MSRPQESAYFLAAAVIFALVSIKPNLASAYDAAADFSATNNPNGVWKYGWSASLTPGASLNLYTRPTRGSGLNGWDDPNHVSLGAPTVTHNGTNPQIDASGIRWQPGQMAFHPGQAGEYSFVRWTAPNAQTYVVAATFTGIDFQGGTTTDVHVLHNGVSLFSGLVNGFGNTASFPATLVSVLAGDTIDFAVGFGTTSSFFFDSTGLAATISSVTTPAVVSSLCGTGSPPPARISGSTGGQGVLDPANANASDGLVWPVGAVTALIDMRTGLVSFQNASGIPLASATLPGVSGTPAFPDGKLNFTSVHLPAGTSVIFAAFGSTSGVLIPVLLLSCQDVLLDATSRLGAGGGLGPAGVPGAFLGAGGAPSIPPNSAGFGPRSGSLPAAGSLYPAIGGAGGNSGNGTPLFPSVLCGGSGGPPLVIAAAQRVTLNGTVLAAGADACTVTGGTVVSQGGGGGSVRLAAVLVEGVGTINTSAGKDSDGAVRGPAGPIEIEGFVQNLFSGTLTGNATPCTTNKNCAVMAPLPSNVPAMKMVGVSVGGQPSCGLGSQIACPNTGSLVVPDVVLPAAAGVQSVTVTAEVDFQKCVETGLVPALTLAFRAVGTDGSAQSTSGNTVLGTSCTTAAQTPGVLDVTASAVVNLTPEVTYQIVVTPTTAVAVPASVGATLLRSAAGSERGRSPESEVRSQKPEAGSAPIRAATHSTSSGQAVSERGGEGSDNAQLRERWARLFGVESPTGKRVAQLSVAVGTEKQ